MRIFLSAADASGDFTGSLLIAKIREISPVAEFFAVGGPYLQAAGAGIIGDSSDWSSIGFFDSLKKVPAVLRAYPGIRRKLEALHPDGIAYLDGPAFNMRLAGRLRRKKIRSIYFFPPSAWKNDAKRARAVGKLVDLVIAPFQETAKIYAASGVPTFFSGHPLLDCLPPREDRKKLLRELELESGNPVIGLFPGSRDQEIKYLLPALLEAASRVMMRIPSVQFVLAIARESLAPAIFGEISRRGLPVKAKVGVNYKVMQAADFLVLASGTASLEAALYEKPMLIVYKVSPWTWLLERPFLKGVRFAGLPNLLAGREIVPELLQEKADPAIVAEKVIEFLEGGEERSRMTRELRLVRAQLGSPGALERAAKQILETFR